MTRGARSLRGAVWIFCCVALAHPRAADALGECNAVDVESSADCAAPYKARCVSSAQGPDTDANADAADMGTTCVWCTRRIQICREQRVSGCVADMTCRQRGVCENGLHYEVVYERGCVASWCGGENRISCVQRANEGRLTVATAEGGAFDIPAAAIPQYEQAAKSDLDAALSPLPVTVLAAYVNPTDASLLHVAFRVTPSEADLVRQASVDAVFESRSIALDELQTVHFQLTREVVALVMDNATSASHAPQLAYESPPDTDGGGGNKVMVIALCVVAGVVVALVVITGALYYRHTHQANRAVVKPSGGRMTDIAKGGIAGFNGGIMPSMDDEDERIRRERKARSRQRQSKGVSGAAREREQRNDAAAAMGKGGAVQMVRKAEGPAPAADGVTAGGPGEEGSAAEFALDMSDAERASPPPDV